MKQAILQKETKAKYLETSSIDSNKMQHFSTNAHEKVFSTVALPSGARKNQQQIDGKYLQNEVTENMALNTEEIYMADENKAKFGKLNLSTTYYSANNETELTNNGFSSIDENFSHKQLDAMTGRAEDCSEESHTSAGFDSEGAEENSFSGNNADKNMDNAITENRDYDTEVKNIETSAIIIYVRGTTSNGLSDCSKDISQIKSTLNPTAEMEKCSEVTFDSDKNNKTIDIATSRIECTLNTVDKSMVKFTSTNEATEKCPLKKEEMILDKLLHEPSTTKSSDSGSLNTENKCLLDSLLSKSSSQSKLQEYPTQCSIKKEDFVSRETCVNDLHLTTIKPVGCNNELNIKRELKSYNGKINRIYFTTGYRRVAQSSSNLPLVKRKVNPQKILSKMDRLQRDLKVNILFNCMNAFLFFPTLLKLKVLCTQPNKRIYYTWSMVVWHSSFKTCTLF